MCEYQYADNLFYFYFMNIFNKLKLIWFTYNKYKTFGIFFIYAYSSN